MTFRTLLSLLIVYFIKYNKMDKETEVHKNLKCESVKY